MKRVSRFEANLLQLLRAFLHQAPVQPALHLLEMRLERPPCLGRNALDLIKDTLARGLVLLLARAGGWRVERHLRADQVVVGRLWERTPPERLGLAFSPNTLDFLCWLTAKKPAEDRHGWQPVTEPTLGDLMFLWCVHAPLRDTEFGGPLLKGALRTHGLLALGCADDLARAGVSEPPDFAPWVSGTGACLVEALQPVLAERWVRMEIDKSEIVDWKVMRDLGAAQERAVDGFLEAIDAVNRPDLARFLLMAARRVLTETATAGMWTRSLRQQAPRLADRAATYRGALALLRALPRLQQWERRARAVGYFDDGYQASQLWKADWEQYHGDQLTQRAQDIVQQLDPMRQTEG